MAALFYVAGAEWNASARVFLAAARGLAARGQETLIVCGSGTPVVEHVAGSGVDNVLVDPVARIPSATWELRRIMQDRVVGPAFVHTDREQLVASVATRLAESGAVIRRVPPFTNMVHESGSFATRVAAAGLLFSTEAERAAEESRGWKIAPAVAPLGVEATGYDGLLPESRAALGVPAQATLIVCPYDRSGRTRLSTVMRALALLAPRHPDLHALVLGPTALDEQLRLHASALSIGGLMTFVEEVPDPIRVLLAADIVWVTAEADTGAFGFLDAMALRIPVVAERSRLAEHFVIDGQTGVLLASPDAPAVSAAIAQLVAHPDQRTAMGIAGRSRVEREFTAVAMIDGFERAATYATDRSPSMHR